MPKSLFVEDGFRIFVNYKTKSKMFSDDIRKVEESGSFQKAVGEPLRKKKEEDSITKTPEQKRLKKIAKAKQQ